MRRVTISLRSRKAKDVAGKRNIVGSGRYQEAILARWDEENRPKK